MSELSGITILLTRPLHQLEPFRGQLAEAGAIVFVQPTIEILPPLTWNEVDTAITQYLNDTYHWMFFSSSNGVHSFAERLPNGRFPVILPNTSFGTVGPQTAVCLEQYGVPRDRILVPTADTGYSADGLAATLAPLMKNAQNLRCLCVRADRGRDTLAIHLRHFGARVEEVAAYQSVDVKTPIPEIVHLVQSCPQLWITVTSSAIATSIVRLLGPTFGDNCRFLSLSPLTSATLRGLGISPRQLVESATATTDGMIETLRLQ